MQDHRECVISQLLIFTNDTEINRFHVVIKANSCDNYEQDTQKIVSCRAVTNPDLNISRCVYRNFEIPKDSKDSRKWL